MTLTTRDVVEAFTCAYKGLYISAKIDGSI